MKKIIYLLIVASCFAFSCNEAGKTKPLSTEEKQLANVRRSFPGSDVYTEENLNYTYFLVDSLGVRKVTVDANANISGIYWFVFVENKPAK